VIAVNGTGVGLAIIGSAPTLPGARNTKKRGASSYIPKHLEGYFLIFTVDNPQERAIK
jgi:hypothetical protein